MLSFVGKALGDFLHRGENLCSAGNVVRRLSHTCSNCSGYSEAKTTRPTVARAAPAGRRPLIRSSAPAVTEPITTAFFQLTINFSVPKKSLV